MSEPDDPAVNMLGVDGEGIRNEDMCIQPAEEKRLLIVQLIIDLGDKLVIVFRKPGCCR